VEKKKQVILYNLLDWIKTDIKEQIGYALITRRLDFIDKLEKRVKSRMNAKMVFLLGPRDERVIKEAIIKRFKYSLKGIEDETLSLQSTKIIHFI
jgi:Cdc6-like AAA superfamily ATPase